MSTAEMAPASVLVRPAWCLPRVLLRAGSPCPQVASNCKCLLVPWLVSSSVMGPPLWWPSPFSSKFFAIFHWFVSWFLCFGQIICCSYSFMWLFALKVPDIPKKILFWSRASQPGKHQPMFVLAWQAASRPELAKAKYGLNFIVRWLNTTDAQ